MNKNGLITAALLTAACIVPGHADARQPTPQERALMHLHPRATDVRCGQLTCRATFRGVITFYVAVRWASDGRWHFRAVGAVA